MSEDAGMKGKNLRESDIDREAHTTPQIVREREQERVCGRKSASSGRETHP